MGRSLRVCIKDVHISAGYGRAWLYGRHRGRSHQSTTIVCISTRRVIITITNASFAFKFYAAPHRHSWPIAVPLMRELLISYFLGIFSLRPTFQLSFLTLVDFFFFFFGHNMVYTLISHLFCVYFLGRRGSLIGTIRMNEIRAMTVHAMKLRRMVAS